MDSEELVTISDGSNFTILVDGIKWAQPQLKKHYTKGEKQLFSITPPCDYQLKHEWPEPPFVNINTFLSKETTKQNWLGFIHSHGDDGKDSFFADNMLKILPHKNVAVWGKIIKEDDPNFGEVGEYKILLFLSRSDLVNQAKGYKQPTKKTETSYAPRNDEKRINKHVFVWGFAFICGSISVDRFYRGQIGLGILKMLFGCGIWQLVDLIIAINEAYSSKHFGNEEDIGFHALSGKYLK